MLSSIESVVDTEVDLKHINDSYIRLWENYATAGEEVTNRYPLQYPAKMKRASLLFVGFNPSFRAPEKFKPRKETGLDRDMNEEEFYKWKGALDTEEFYVAEMKFLSGMTKERMEEEDGYFRVLAEVTKKSHFNHWEHMDIFAVRDTKQDKVINLLRTHPLKKDVDGIDDFEMTNMAKEQVEIAFELMTLLEPQAIVVISAIGSRLVRNVAVKKANAQFKEQWGTYGIVLNGKTVPLFLCGMLARQHALDVFSRERLIWQLRYVKNLANQS